MENLTEHQLLEIILGISIFIFLALIGLFYIIIAYFTDNLFEDYDKDIKNQPCKHSEDGYCIKEENNYCNQKCNYNGDYYLQTR